MLFAFYCLDGPNTPYLSAARDWIATEPVQPHRWLYQYSDRPLRR